MKTTCTISVCSDLFNLRYAQLVKLFFNADSGRGLGYDERLLPLINAMHLA